MLMVLYYRQKTFDLGIIMDSKLRFDEHISSMVNKARARAALILQWRSQGGAGGPGSPPQLLGKKNKYILGTYTVLKDDITVIDGLENNSKYCTFLL